MTSASELFNNRRSRIGGRPELGFGSSSNQQSLSYNFHDRHHHGHRRRHHPRPFSRYHESSSYNNEPSREEMREEMEDFDLFLRRSAGHPTYRDYGPVQVDHLPSPTSPGNSSSNGNSSSRANRMQHSRSDELPGDVLLARERLFERLRGVSLSSNRESSRTTSWNMLPYNNNPADTAELDFIEASIDRLAEEHPLNGSAGDAQFSLRRIPLTMRSSMQEVRPRGLVQQEVSSLLQEAFTIEDEEVLASAAVTVCSICLNSFHQGDELIRVPCQHMFHASCLCPWVKICADCPNCRAAVVVSTST